MRYHCVAAIVLRQIYLMRSSFTRIFPLFIWVAIDIVLWGFVTKYLNSIASPGFNFVPMFLGCVLLWDFLTRVMHGVSMAFMEDIWSRNFLNLFASPLSVRDYLTGLIATGIATSMVGLVTMLLLATCVFGLSFFSYGLWLLPFLLMLFLFGIALGIAGSAIMLRYGPASEWFVWPIPAFVSPFACVLYPLSTLPHWMQWIAHVLPPSYVFEGMRSIVHGGAVDGGAFAAGMLLAVLYIVGACLFFLRVYRHAVNTGLIARYSAESVG